MCFSNCQCLLCQIGNCSYETNGNETTDTHEPNRISNQMTKSEEKINRNGSAKKRR